MSLSLLLVEDDPRFRETLALELEDAGYAVQTASGLPEVRTALLKERFAFAVVDLRLGQDHGLEAIDLLKAANAECRIVMITGYASIATAVEAVKRGAAQYLSKPISISELVHALRSDAPLAASSPTAESRVESLARHEREYIEFVLMQSDQNISEAARRLGIHRQSLQRKLRKYTPD